MRLDPFRVQILTVSLDSLIVLTIVGLSVAGMVFRQAARQESVDLSAGHWWDLVVGTVVGGRLVWVITHAEYYLRQPLQVVVVLDGGLHAVGLAAGAAYWVWRLGRIDGAPSWRFAVDLVAIGVLTTFLFERVGCALTTCGTGPASELPGAILRGDEWRAPMAMPQVVILAVALIVAAETLRVRGAAFITTLIALMVVEAVAFSAGRPVVEGVAALGVVAAIYAVMARRTTIATGKGAGGRPGNRGPETSQPPRRAADRERR